MSINRCNLAMINSRESTSWRRIPPSCPGSWRTTWCSASSGQPTWPTTWWGRALPGPSWGPMSTSLRTETGKMSRWALQRQQQTNLLFTIGWQIITINGANVLKSDIATRTGGGLVHVVDRVLFPPTVGDVVQTLQVSHLLSSLQSISDNSFDFWHVVAVEIVFYLH